MHASEFLFDLTIVLGVAAATSLLARLLRQPSILGYLFAGLIVGPYIPVPLFADPERIESMAEFGVILVMFAIGLEFRIRKLGRVLPVAGLTALVQISVLMWAGFSAGRAFGWTVVESLFLGSAIAISSTMVVSRVFDQRPTGEGVREYVLGVLILQDVAAIALIAVMTGVAAGGGLAPAELAVTMGRLAGVLAAILVLGMLLVPRVIRGVARLRSPELLGVFSIGLCFVLAVTAEELGYSVALGAFLAGILVAESGHAHEVEVRIEPVRDMFAAIFFVSIGMTVNPSLALAHLPTAAVVFLVVVFGQLASVSVAGVFSGNGLRRSITAGLALGQIGEFGFILAAIGAGAGVVGEALQPILVTVAIGTAFSTPLLLGQAPRIARLADRLLPHRVQWMLDLYEAWLARARARGGGRPAGGRSEMARAVRAIAVDVVVLNLVFGLEMISLGEVGQWLAGHLGIGVGASRAVILLVSAVAAAPFLIGLVRNSVALARLSGETMLREMASGPAAGTSIAVHTLRALILMAVLLGAGLPTIAVMRPLTGGLYGSAAFVVLVLVAGVTVWRSAGAMELELRSGVEHVADILSSQSADEETMSADEAALPPGLDSLVGLRVPGGAAVIGRSLAEIDLRARTGSTVVAIQRRGDQVILPTGRERLEEGDVLALSGTSEALREAKSILRSREDSGSS